MFLRSTSTGQAIRCFIYSRSRAQNCSHSVTITMLLQEGRRNVVDAAGDYDLVEWRLLFPTVMAVRMRGRDGLVLAVAAPDERIVKRPRPLGERLDDLDRPDLVRQIGKV